jgi:hypothetical protein
MVALAAVAALGCDLSRDAQALCFTGCSSSSACNGSGHCSCQVTCTGPGVCSCADILCGQCSSAPSGEAAFALSPAAFDTAAAQAPLAATVLKNLSEHCQRMVVNGVTGGIANLGDGDFRYQGTTTASPSAVTLRFAFSRIGDGPLPQDAAYEVDSAGEVTQIE